MLHDSNITVPDNKNDLIVHNNNDVDMVQDTETEQEVNDDEPLDRPRREVHVPRYLAGNYVLDFKDTDNINIDYCYKMCMTQHDIPDSYEEVIEK